MGGQLISPRGNYVELSDDSDGDITLVKQNSEVRLVHTPFRKREEEYI